MKISHIYILACTYVININDVSLFCKDSGGSCLSVPVMWFSAHVPWASYWNFHMVATEDFLKSQLLRTLLIAPETYRNKSRSSERDFSSQNRPVIAVDRAGRYATWNDVQHVDFPSDVWSFRWKWRFPTCFLMCLIHLMVRFNCRTLSRIRLFLVVWNLGAASTASYLMVQSFRQRLKDCRISWTCWNIWIDFRNSAHNKDHWSQEHATWVTILKILFVITWTSYIFWMSQSCITKASSNNC